MPRIDVKTLEVQSPDAGPAPDTCFHCGEPLRGVTIRKSDKHFCCNGCKLAYELLSDNDLCTYYDLSDQPGQTPQESGAATRFAYLDEPEIQDQLIRFSDGSISRFTFTVLGMHCASCIWLLEKLYRFDPGVSSSTVDFLKKTVEISYFPKKTSIRRIAELLSSLGYEPEINTREVESDAQSRAVKSLYIRIGVAGFALGNIMLLSIPEYIPHIDSIAPEFKGFFGWLNLILALPVLLISSRGYLSSALEGLKRKIINIDVPIALGIITLFLRSTVDIVTGQGAGFMDSFAGLVFLLLMGKLFQQRTYDNLSFERDYKAYFPISVIRKTDTGEKNIALSELKRGDRIVVRNGELIPADSVLLYQGTTIDYSFVTGESVPVERQPGELVYAGGRQIGGAAEMDVVKEVSQSYLTQLWNKDIYGKSDSSRIQSVTDGISRYFTLAVLIIAGSAGGYWMIVDPSFITNAVTAVLIIACPCALALSAPFTLGSVMRILGRNRFYIKNTHVIEALANINTILFDKTGTLTESGSARIRFFPADGSDEKLQGETRSMIRSLSRQSNHPLSQRIYQLLDDADLLPVSEYREHPGQGQQGMVNEMEVKLGSADFIGYKGAAVAGSAVHCSINGRILGNFQISSVYRSGLTKMLAELRHHFRLEVVTGDTDWEREKLEQRFQKEELYFSQSPFDKLKRVQSLQDRRQRVLMLGDGLNDAGALRQSAVGVAISEDKNAFSPACDGILEAAELVQLPAIIRLSKSGMHIIYISFAISLMYNVIGLSYAVTGRLSPLISAILMPLSSISVILFATLSTNLSARRAGLWRDMDTE